MSTAWYYGDSNEGREDSSDSMLQQQRNKAPTHSENLQEQSEMVQGMRLEEADLEHLVEGFRLDKTVQRLSREHLLTGTNPCMLSYGVSPTSMF